MTAAEAISHADEVCPNVFPESIKLKWLSTLDGQIYTEIILTHEGRTEPFTPYKDKERELLVPEPYGEGVYINYLQAQMDKANGEYQKYNSSSALFNAGYQAYANWYNRTHRPLSSQRFLF